MLSLKNNITTDGLYYRDSEIECYNNGCLFLYVRATNQRRTLSYNGFFINRIANYVIFTPKEMGFILLAYDIFTENTISITDCDTRWCVVRSDRYVYYTKGEANYLYEFDIKLWKERCLLSHSCNYLAVNGDILYFSDWSNKQYLCSLNLDTYFYNVIVSLDVAWINIVDEYNLLFRCWHNRKTYLFNLQTNDLSLLNVDSANYICYDNGYIYYDNIKYGGLYQQSIISKHIKRRLFDGKTRRVAIVDDNTICFQNSSKETCFVRMDE